MKHKLFIKTIILSAGLFLSCTASAAVPSQMTGHVFHDRPHCIMSHLITSNETLLATPTGAALRIFENKINSLLDRNNSGWILSPGRAGRFSVGVSLNDKLEISNQIVLAAELQKKDGIEIPDFPTFNISAPEGTILTPLSSFRYATYTFYTALLEKSNSTFFLLASSTELLSEMASAPGDARSLSSSGAALSVYLKTQRPSASITVQFPYCPDSIRADISSEKTLPLCSRVLRTPSFTGENLIGYLTAPFTCFSKTKQARRAAKISEDRLFVTSLKKSLPGLTESSIREVKNSTVTVGLCGRNTLLMFPIPGLFAKIDNLSPRTAKNLGEELAKQIDRIYNIQGAPFQTGDFTGTRATGLFPLSGYVAQNGHSVVIALQHTDDLRYQPENISRFFGDPYAPASLKADIDFDILRSEIQTALPYLLRLIKPLGKGQSDDFLSTLETLSAFHLKAEANKAEVVLSVKPEQFINRLQQLFPMPL